LHLPFCLEALLGISRISTTFVQVWMTSAAGNRRWHALTIGLFNMAGSLDGKRQAIG
jgi:hypothetical protein